MGTATDGGGHGSSDDRIGNRRYDGHGRGRMDPAGNKMPESIAADRFGALSLASVARWYSPPFHNTITYEKEEKPFLTG